MQVLLEVVITNNVELASSMSETNAYQDVGQEMGLSSSPAERMHSHCFGSLGKF